MTTNDVATVAPNRKFPRARGVVRLERVAARVSTATRIEWSDAIKAEIAATRDMVRADIVRRATEGDEQAARLLMVEF